MNIPTIPDEYQANFHYLITAIATVHRTLEKYIAQQQEHTNAYEENVEEDVSVLQTIQTTMSSPPALEQLCAIFQLSPFERNILLLCAGMSLFHDFPGLCANAQGSPQMNYPTFGLAMQIFPQPRWEAFIPQAPLRYWLMLQLGSGQALSLCPLQLDEGILHYLCGEPYQDPYLFNLIKPLSKTAFAHPPLPKSHLQLVEQILTTLSNAVQSSSLPLIQIYGTDSADIRAIVATCARVVQLKILSALDLPTDTVERLQLMRRWEREVALADCVLVINCESINRAESTQMTALLNFIQEIDSSLIITHTERLQIQHRSIINFEVPKLSPLEQQFLWQKMLSSMTTDFSESIDNLIAQFNLSPAALQTVAFAIQQQNAQPTKSTQFSQQLWEICRSLARPHLDNLAQRIDSKTAWEDLILPTKQRQTLRYIAAYVRQRFKVYQKWVFANKGERGLGISALFAGSSGTGKTMAAEVLANELQLDLSRIDLSAVMSKYIGETEKNLRQIFDAAETGGVILLFDEADAIFGKRTEVKDSHDRHANVEVSYLLQRMEAYQGLAILTTNFKENMDNAFMRRIRFVISFPFPDVAARADIWQRIFPSQMPQQGLDMHKLAQLKVAGGSIRNIALNAAMTAADANEAVMMKHILHAAKNEYIKLEKSLNESEIRNWV